MKRKTRLYHSVGTNIKNEKNYICYPCILFKYKLIETDEYVHKYI